MLSLYILVRFWAKKVQTLYHPAGLEYAISLRLTVGTVTFEGVVREYGVDGTTQAQAGLGIPNLSCGSHLTDCFLIIDRHGSAERPTSRVR
jgi:hypothetical protein